MRGILKRYKDKVCTFNDDIQGTGAVSLAAVLSCAKASKVPLKEHRVVIFGAGTAGIGIAERVCVKHWCARGLVRKNHTSAFGA